MNLVIMDFQFSDHFGKTFMECLTKYYAGQYRGYKDEQNIVLL